MTRRLERGGRRSDVHGSDVGGRVQSTEECEGHREQGGDAVPRKSPGTNAAVPLGGKRWGAADTE